MSEEQTINSSISMETIELLSQQNVDMANQDRVSSSQTPYDGQLDKLGEVRLRLAMVTNPEKFKMYDDTSAANPVNMENVFNPNTGMMAISWIGLPGGVIRSRSTSKKEGDSSSSNDDSQTWQNNYKEVYEDATKIYPEDRTHAQWTVTSRREMLQLTHPFIWSNGENYCGINYIPPVGSIVVVGFRKQGVPVVVGYINSHYRICKPVLNPGETVIKGYGNNYMHCRWSDKLDLHARAEVGKVDLDCNVDKKIANEDDCTIWVRLNANDQTLTLSASKHISDHPYQAPYTLLKITPKDLTMITKVEDNYSKYYQDSKNVNIETETVKITASKLIKMNAPKITQN